MKANDYISEKELVIRLTEGDKSAFCKLYSLYRAQLTFFAFKFLKSSTYTEDIVQDTFLHVWLGRKFIRTDQPFSAYLYTIAKNRILNQLRSMEHQQILEEHLLKNAIDYTEDAQDSIRSQDLKDIIQKAFETLSPRQQEVFRLSREGQLSYKEIAEKLGISVNTVHEHITVCLSTIRHYLIKYGKINSDLLLIVFLIIFKKG